MRAIENKKARLLKTRGAGVARAYGIWVSMRSRCRHAHPHRNERCYAGVSVCARWSDFEFFLADMGEPPAGNTIDRIDPKGNYEPHNCRWADTRTQARNRSCAKLNPAAATEIRAQYARGLSQRAIATEYAISQKMVSLIVREEAGAS